MRPTETRKPQPRRLIVALSGSTGPHYGVRLLEVLRAHTDIETHLILTAAARKTIEVETGKDPTAVAALAHRYPCLTTRSCKIWSGPGS